MSSCSHPIEQTARGLSSMHLRGFFSSSGSSAPPSPFGSDEGQAPLRPDFLSAIFSITPSLFMICLVRAGRCSW